MTSPQPGDLIFVSGRGFLSLLIHVGQRLRSAERYARFTHVALVVDAENVVEAHLAGVRKAPIAGMTEPYSVCSVPLDAGGRAHATRYALERVGREYGVLTIVALALQLVTGWPFTFQSDNSWTCSQLAAEALEHGGIDFGEDSSRMTPAMLAEFFHV